MRRRGTGGELASPNLTAEVAKTTADINSKMARRTLESQVVRIDRLDWIAARLPSNRLARVESSDLNEIA